MQYLDKLTSRITMYRLMVYVLLALAGYAMLLGIFDLVQFDPFAMAWGLIVLVVASLGVNYAFAYIYGIRRNSESALITALILFFIFSPPTSSLASLIILALVAIIAGASKYLLAWRGRHIFNPAAIAAVISGIIGLRYASWWVATSALIIPTLLLGMLMLYKTRRLRMGTIFVCVSVISMLVTSALKGYDMASVVSLMLNSWPVFFFAGFMFSEPLTLPPRRYQRIILAIGVGILMGAGLKVGGILISPEIALVVGNVYAFFCGQRGGVRLKLVGRKQLSRDQIEYSFEPARKLHFAPGQYIELQLPHAHADRRGMRRMFTIASAPGEKMIKIATRHYQPSSTFKKALQRLSVGTTLSATGIYGDFLLPQSSSEKILLIAGGIGITPFKAQLEWLLSQHQVRDGILLYAVREPSDAIYKEVLLAEEHGVKTHIVTGPIDTAVLASYAPDIHERHVYVSGPSAMVDALYVSAKQTGAKKVNRDYFTGY